MTELNPQTFDIDDWLEDANLPEESADIYKRPDVIGKLTRLKTRIEEERHAARLNPERTAADKAQAKALEGQYEALLRTFSESRMTVYVRALTPDEMAALRNSHEKRTEGWDPTKANRAFGYDILAAAITAVQPEGQERQNVTLTVAKVKQLENKIGTAQLSEILAARQTAQNAVPAVDADFLLRPSGTSEGSPE